MAPNAFGCGVKCRSSKLSGWAGPHPQPPQRDPIIPKPRPHPCGPTFVTSFYGMNFVNMPELNWDFGELYSLARAARTHKVRWGEVVPPILVGNSPPTQIIAEGTAKCFNFVERLHCLHLSGGFPCFLFAFISQSVRRVPPLPVRAALSLALIGGAITLVLLFLWWHGFICQRSVNRRPGMTN